MVLLASRTDGSLRVDGMRVGVDDWIGKPIDEHEVVSRVEAMLRMKQLHDQVAAARAQLDELASHDGLTGLHNFRHASARLGEEFKRSERYHDPLACLLLDIDGLRHWNERFGRPFGDELVRAVGRTLRGALRDVDVVARYGGDEFLVILPATHFAGALSASDRVFRDVRTTAIVAPDGSRVRVSLSVGVSLFPSRDVRTKDQLLRAAEASLLRSKRDGGDRICVFQHQGYIYSPDSNFTPSTSSAPPVAPKPPSNSGIVAARHLPAVEQPMAAVPGDRRRGPNRGEP
jgi:diguanylate cyclase (GGDEF)-like protein